MLTATPIAYHLVSMNRERLSQAVAEAVRRSRSSIRALAREVEVSHVMLFQVRDGQRPAPPALAKRIAAVLDARGEDLTKLAREIREALAAELPSEED